MRRFALDLPPANDTEENVTELETNHNSNCEAQLRAMLPLRARRDLVGSAPAPARRLDVVTDGEFRWIETVEDCDGKPAGVIEYVEQMGFRPNHDE